MSGADADVLFAGRTREPVRVAIPSTDAGFAASQGCGRWTLQLPPTPPPPLVPIPVPPGFPKPGEAATISSGGGHTCALRFDGSPVCWEGNFAGESGPPVKERFVAITAGTDHVCGLRPDGAPVCWGDNNSIGQLPEGERFALERVQAPG